MKLNAEKRDELRAFAQRVERQILAAKHKGMENMERLVCRFLTDKKNVKVAAVMTGKWVEWRYGKPKETVEHAGGDNGPIVHTIRFGDGKRDE